MRGHLARAFLILSLLAFAAFHFLPWWSDLNSLQQGWMVWIEIVGSFVNRSVNGIDALGAVALATSALIMVVAPFLIGAMGRSRLIWWLLVLFSGICLVSVSGVIAYFMGLLHGDFSDAGSGMLAVIAAQILNFTGLLLLPRAPVPSLPAPLGEPTFPG